MFFCNEIRPCTLLGGGPRGLGSGQMRLSIVWKGGKELPLGHTQWLFYITVLSLQTCTGISEAAVNSNANSSGLCQRVNSLYQYNATPVSLLTSVRTLGVSVWEVRRGVVGPAPPRLRAVLPSRGRNI